MRSPPPPFEESPNAANLAKRKPAREHTNLRGRGSTAPARSQPRQHSRGNAPRAATRAGAARGVLLVPPRQIGSARAGGLHPGSLPFGHVRPRRHTGARGLLASGHASRGGRTAEAREHRSDRLVEPHHRRSLLARPLPAETRTAPADSRSLPAPSDQRRGGCVATAPSLARSGFLIGLPGDLVRKAG